MSRFPPGLLTLMILLGFGGCFIPVVTKRTRESNVVKMKEKKNTECGAHNTISPLMDRLGGDTHRRRVTTHHDNIYRITSRNVKRTE